MDKDMKCLFLIDVAQTKNQVNIEVFNWDENEFKSTAKLGKVLVLLPSNI
jgi:hypothetical protein